MSSNVMDLSDSQFETEVLQNALPVLVDFWAPWCGPCRTLAPVLSDIATDLAGKLKVVKVDTDQNQVYATKFGVSSIPTLLVVKGGVVVDRLVGARPKSALVQFLTPHV